MALDNVVDAYCRCGVRFVRGLVVKRDVIGAVNFDRALKSAQRGRGVVRRTDSVAAFDTILDGLAAMMFVVLVVSLTAGGGHS